jgi:phenylalanine-4-hydroxylase
MTFDQCLVMQRDQALFLPEWGLYDMAVGEAIVSVYAGPADSEAFGLSYPVPQEKTHKIRYTQNAIRLHELYQLSADMRNQGLDHAIMEDLWKTILKEYPDEWLLALEIYEILLINHHLALAGEVKNHLERISGRNHDAHKLIADGIELLASW